MSRVSADKMSRWTVSILCGAGLLLLAHAQGRLDSLPSIAIFGCCAAICALAVFFLYPIHTRAALQGRVPWPLRDLYADGYSQTGIEWESFRDNWTQVAKCLGESPEVLRPTDRFAKELKHRSPLDWSNDDLVEFVRQRLGKEARLDTIETMDALIKLLCSRTRATG